MLYISKRIFHRSWYMLTCSLVALLLLMHPLFAADLVYRRMTPPEQVARYFPPIPRPTTEKLSAAFRSPLPRSPLMRSMAAPAALPHWLSRMPIAEKIPHRQSGRQWHQHRH